MRQKWRKTNIISCRMARIAANVNPRTTVLAAALNVINLQHAVRAAGTDEIKPFHGRAE
jgi:hypothetical protein